MLFNSYIFIFLFLPVTLLGFYLLGNLCSGRAAKAFLVMMSLWFYAYFEITYLPIILASIAVNYGLHLFLTGPAAGTRQSAVARKAVPVLGLIFNLGLLGVFKYLGFVCDNLSHITHTQLSAPALLLPLGISFFTFQQIGFLVDTARGEVSRQKLLDYSLFVTFFPQLIAGPIVNHDEMLPQFCRMDFKLPEADRLYSGVTLFVYGLAKKVLLADVIGNAVNWGFENYGLLDGPAALFVMVMYSFQLYLDFSGYCDMARGCARLFGIELPENFRNPYRAKDILEFWDRWHITLTRFFTRYVYIPLGGSRCGTVRTCVNVMIVFLLSGIWHGAGWQFILWGILHGAASVTVRLYYERAGRTGHGRQESAGVTSGLSRIGILINFAFVTVCWTFFRADSVSHGIGMLASACSGVSRCITTELTQFFRPELLGNAVLALVPSLSGFVDLFGTVLYTAVAVFVIFVAKHETVGEAEVKPCLVRTLFLSFLFVSSVLSLGTVSTFLYFNF